MSKSRDGRSFSDRAPSGECRLRGFEREDFKSSCLSDRPLVCSNIMAVAGDQTLKFKLVTFCMGDKDGESHMVGVSVSPNGTIGTKDFYDKQGENGASTGHSTYYFPDGSLMANYSNVSTGTNSGGHIVGKYQIVSGTGAYQGATGGGSIDGDWGDKSPLKNAGLFNIELDVKTPGT